MADFADQGDALTAPFWAGAMRRKLMVQRCRSCGRHQFYPRAFCIVCRSDDVSWVEASGEGVVYSLTVVRRNAAPGAEVPYVNALVDLDEGPRLFTTLERLDCQIGERVRVTWRDRVDAPPLPIFEKVN